MSCLQPSEPNEISNILPLVPLQLHPGGQDWMQSPWIHLCLLRDHLRILPRECRSVPIAPPSYLLRLLQLSQDEAGTNPLDGRKQDGPLERPPSRLRCRGSFSPFFPPPLLGGQIQGNYRLQCLFTLSPLGSSFHDLRISDWAQALQNQFSENSSVNSARGELLHILRVSDIKGCWYRTWRERWLTSSHSPLIA